MDEKNVVENFYGVYLLYCLNPKYLGRTYIGYTVDPNRRIKQHNKGKKFGGAWRTSNRGPWTMVLIVHGFPNDISALRFEWAWQHSDSSRRLHHVAKKKSSEKRYDFNFRVLSEMLKVGPWNRLPLTIRWLNQDFSREFPVGKNPPLHMPITFGSVVSKKLPKIKLTQENSPCSSQEEISMCYLCSNYIEPLKKVTCLDLKCKISCHLICMSSYFLTPGNYVPIERNCPKCTNKFLWGDIIRKFKGCYQNMDLKINTEDPNSFYCSDADEEN